MTPVSKNRSVTSPAVPGGHVA